MNKHHKRLMSVRVCKGLRESERTTGIRGERERERELLYEQMRARSRSGCLAVVSRILGRKKVSVEEEDKRQGCCRSHLAWRPRESSVRHGSGGAQL